MERVVVTGVGVVSALGLKAQTFMEALRAGHSGIGPIMQPDVSSLRFQNAAEVRNFNAAEYFDEKLLSWLDPFAQYGMVAAREAIRDAQIEWTDALRARSGVITGSCLGGAPTAVLAMHHGFLPPTANFLEPDPECDLDVIPNEARPAEVEAALSNSFAFGGLNAVTAFKRWRN